MAVLATWKKGINDIPGEPVMLPEKIKWTPRVNMQEVINLKKEVKNSKEHPTPYQVDLLRYYQWKHVNDVLSHPLHESYQAKIIKNFKWDDKEKIFTKPFARSDTRLKNYPYRKRPIVESK